MRIRSETRMEGQGGHVGRCWAHCGRCQGREVHMRISREYKEKLKKKGKKEGEEGENKSLLAGVEKPC